MSYEMDSIALVTTFAHYAQNKRLPTELFTNPDCITLQATDLQDFSHRIEETKPRAEQITVAEAENRFVATIKLAGALGVVDLGRARWLEIVEPTKEELQLEMIGGDTVGFYYDDFEKARHVLGARGLNYTIDDYPAPTIKVEYGTSGEGFRLSNTPKQALVEQDILAERVTVVKRAA